MTNLQDLVTGAMPDIAKEEVPEHTFEPRPPLEISRERVDFDDMLWLCDYFRRELAERPERAPYLLSQLLSYFEQGPIPSYSFAPAREPLRIFSVASTYAIEPSSDGLQSLLKWVSEAEELIDDYRFAKERNKLIGTRTSQIDFLSDFFGEDLIQELAELGDVRPVTARKWITGNSSPSWRNGQSVQLLARVFYTARHRKNMSNEEILRWYREGGSPSPKELLGFYGGSYITDELARVLREVDFRDI